jgi:hypothetical protein
MATLRAPCFAIVEWRSYGVVHQLSGGDAFTRIVMESLQESQDRLAASG